jgi:hypothetical protein
MEFFVTKVLMKAVSVEMELSIKVFKQDQIQTHHYWIDYLIVAFVKECFTDETIQIYSELNLQAGLFYFWLVYYF